MAFYLFVKQKFGISPIKSRALDGWSDGWVGGRARLRIAYSNQKPETRARKQENNKRQNRNINKNKK